MGSFTRWLSGLFGKEAAEIIESGRLREEAAEGLSLKRIAIQTAAGYISSAVSQCDFRTFLDGEEKKGEEFFLWNYSPNPNQNSTQFLQELTEKLIYDNEVLVIEEKGSLYVADTFGTQEDGMKEWMFTGISVAGEAVGDKRAGDVLYFRMNNEDIRPLLEEVCRQYEEVIQSAVSCYERAGADKGILKVQSLARGKLKDYDEIKRDLLNHRFRDFFSRRNAVLPLYDGFEYTPHTRSLRNTSEVVDVKTLSDEIYNRVGQAFRIAPAMLRGEVENTEKAADNFIKFGVRPICNLLEEEITRKRYGKKAFEKGSYLLVDPSGLEIGSVFAAAEKIDKLISCGTYSIDEVRSKIGEPVLGTEESQKHFITKNYEALTGGSKGDEN
ncbi:MAG: phage portal protein [Lachnospiraceae bacterium]|nr:phage portal protein [Lachnospiraceae bacterium]